MAVNPWLTSNDLINAVKRRISFPVYQSTFTDQEILNFANDVVKEELLPNILQYHEEFLVVASSVTIEENRSEYPVPNRAIGMKLRDILYADGNTTPALPYGQIFEMTRVNADDKTWFQSISISNQTPFRYYFQNNNIVLIPSITDNPTGLVVMYWHIRPNQLVEETRAFTINGFSKTVTVTNASIIPGDTVTLSIVNGQVSTPTIFEAVLAAPTGNQFLIGATSSATATNLVTAINNAGIDFSATNGNPATNTVKVLFSNRPNTVESSNSAAFLVQTTLGLESLSTVPSNMTSGTYVDLLQTLPGHRIVNYDILLNTASISGTTLNLPEDSVPADFVVGDYVCSRNECIIPFMPPELHSSLVQRTCSRILEAIGDKEGMAISDSKVEKLNRTEGNLIDVRDDGSPQKVLARHSILRYQGFTDRRRY